MTKRCFAASLVALLACAALSAHGQLVSLRKQLSYNQQLAKVRDAEHRIRSFVREQRKLSEAQLANVAIAQLCVEQARLFLDNTWMAWYHGEDYPARRLEELDRALARARANEPPPIVPGVNELAYFSPLDGSCQPYHLLVPDSYDGTKPTPVIFFLHGYDPAVSKIYPWVPGEYMLDALNKVGMIMAIPYGRKNTDFLGPGECDVLDVLAQVRRWVNVDEQRLYLMGVSAGGSGVWTMATHYPGLFAAILPMCGRTNYYLWKELTPQSLPTPERLRISTNNPIEMPENLRGTPVVIYHGEEDPAIKPDHSRQMAEKLKPLGNCTLHMVPGEGHRVWETVLADDPVPFKEILAFRRNPLPKRVTFKSFSPKYNRAHWVRVLRIVEFGKPFTVDAEIVAPGQVRVRCTNVAQLALDLPSLERGKQWQVEGLPEPPPPREQEKTPAVCGPVENAYCAPFAMVLPTHGTSDELDKDRELATYNVDHWFRFTDGMPRTFADSSMTDFLLKRYNIIAFGSPRTNSVIAKAAHGLPVAFLSNGFEFMGRTFVGENVGLVMVYPNPLAPNRLLCIHSGAIWGRGLELNHRLDAIADLVIFRAGKSSWEPDEILCSAYFDVAWRPDPKLTYFAP